MSTNAYEHVADRSSQLVARSARMLSEKQSEDENHMANLDRGRIDRSQINGLLEKMVSELGADAFSSMRLLQLEAMIRKHNPTVHLPGKTVLRECINKFRSDRWPQAAPKKSSRFW